MTSRGSWKSRVDCVRTRYWAGLVAALVMSVGIPAASAPVDLWGSVGAALYYEQVEGAPSGTRGLLDGRFEVQRSSDPWWVFLVIEPRAQIDLTADGRSPSVSLDVTEAYVSYRGADGDVHVGRLNLPVETSRLVYPYTLMPPDERGRRRGVDGARADLYVGPNRMQLAVLTEGGDWTPLASLRHAASGWEGTVYLLFQRRGLAAGFGWSGLVRSIIGYGEIWTLPGEQGLRYSAGASGYLGDALWTLEMARAPLVPGTLPLVFQTAFQLSFEVVPGLSFVAEGAAALDGARSGAQSGGNKGERAHRWEVTARYELIPGESELELSIQRWARPLVPPVVFAGVGVRYYF